MTQFPPGLYQKYLGFPGGSDSKASVCNAGDQGSIPQSGRSPGEENGSPFWYSCLENPMDEKASQATVVHRVAKSWTQLSDFTFTFLSFRKIGISRQTTNTDYHPPSQSGKLILHYILFKQVYVTEKVREGSWKGLLYLLVSNLSSFLKRASSKYFCLHCRFLAG